MDYIDANAVHRLLDYPGLIDALESAHREASPLVDRSLLQPLGDSPHADESFLVLPAWIPGRVMGVKMATVIPANAERTAGAPTIHAAYQLFDGETGIPIASIDGTALTLRKTAADSGLGSRLLARPDATTLLMVGAGALGPHLIAAHRAARPSINRVLVWNRTPAHRDALVADLRDQGIDAAAVDTPEAGVHAADIISCATAATEPLIRGTWLRPGQHLDLVGAFNPDMRESDDDCVRRAEIFVDLRLSTVDSAGDLVQPIAAGVIGRDAIRGDLYELCRGEARGRSGADAITLFKNGGGGHLDLFTAEHCWRNHCVDGEGGGVAGE
jgi:ornithine cyclodeaminase/alanine dehydrogenase-like protein (mu-crystallin family)